MPTFNLNDLIRIGAKVMLFLAIIGLVQSFSSFLISKIPHITLPNCIGFYFKNFGIEFGFKILISIVLYGFLVKYALSLLSRSLD